ncbi:MAG: hypothetical protein ACI9KM_000566, partial [Rubritalea sp.]
TSPNIKAVNSSAPKTVRLRGENVSFCAELTDYLHILKGVKKFSDYP